MNTEGEQIADRKMVMITKDRCTNPIIEVIEGKLFKNIDFLKHITYNME